MLIPRRKRKEEKQHTEEVKSTNSIQRSKDAMRLPSVKISFTFGRKTTSFQCNTKKASTDKGKEAKQESQAQAMPNEEEIATIVGRQAASYEAEKKQPDVVIDASITGYKDLETILDKIRMSSSKIILTSITIRELAKLQKIKDNKARDAVHILSLAAKEPENFSNVRINEDVGLEDNCIVKYCSDKKEHVVLLSSDKEMVLNARSYGVQAVYLEQSHSKHEVTTKSEKYRTTTLPCARKNGNNLVVIDFHTRKTEACVISNGVKYNSGIARLQLGDEVYMATKQTEGFVCNYYKVTSLSDKDNCLLLFSRLILKYSEVSQLYGDYRDFVQATLRRFPLH